MFNYQCIGNLDICAVCCYATNVHGQANFSNECLGSIDDEGAAKRDTHYELQKSVNYWDLNVVCTFGIFLLVCLIQCHLVYTLLGELI